MTDYSDQTIDTYQNHFDTYVARTVAEPGGEFKDWMDTFLSYLPPHGSILEMGSASGRDARYFASQGYQVLCTDIIPQALRKLAEAGFEVAHFDFRDKPPQEWNQVFDGFFANATLLHAPQHVFEAALGHIKTILKPQGTLAFSLKVGQGHAVTTDKMDAPRYFRYHTKPEIENLLQQLSFQVISVNHADHDKWLHVIAKKTD